MGVPATRREFTMAGQTILHFIDARVTERWSTADLLGLLHQLGAMPLQQAD